MAIREFSVGGLRGLRRAETRELGNLVVLSGPNGAGKSSLLDRLREQRGALAEPGTQVLFVGPHRPWRSSMLSRVSLYGYPLKSFRELLSTDILPNFQYGPPPGLQGIMGAARQSSTSDDSNAFVKTGLARLLDRQTRLLNDTWRAQSGHIEVGDVPDLFKPFRQVVETILPHLSWIGVDDANPDNIQCRFRPADINDHPGFDIGDLSSGEKAALALLLPFVEGQVEQIVNPPDVEPDVVPLTMLLDEPEIHLHPLLQLQILDYLRELADAGTAQFIIATQSPTLLDALTDDELYLISPAALCPDNQLSKLTNSHERLEIARNLTGATHLLTRAKPIVFIEGESTRAGVTSDARLTKLLLPATRAWALVPGRAKRDVVSAVQRLRQDGISLPGTPVFGLVDSDTDNTTGDDHVIDWPVAMIENLLLDANAIFEVLEPFGDVTGVRSCQVVRQTLDTVARERFEDEVRLRVKRALPIGRLEIEPDQLDNPDAVAAEQASRWIARINAIKAEEVETKARSEVDEIVAAGTQLERFHGKKMLQAVYQLLRVAQAGISQPAFSTSVADRAVKSERIQKLAGPAIKRIALYIPSSLAVTIEATGESGAEILGQRCRRHRDLWAAGHPEADGRDDLRRDVFEFARTVDETSRNSIVTLAAEIGTPQ